MTDLWTAAYALRWLILAVALTSLAATATATYLDHLERKSSHDRAADQ